jgi:hypothetical protein
MKGSGQGMPVVPISESKAVTLKTATWKVPIVLDGGPGSDYWIKISTIGSLRPQVIGQSPMFSINGVTATSPANLTITSNAVSLIDITDTMGNTVYIGSSANRTTPYCLLLCLLNLPGESIEILLYQCIHKRL